MPRTRVRTDTVYKFDELSEFAQDKAIEHLYDINIDYEWWEYDGHTGFTADEIKKYGLSENAGDLLTFKKMYFDLDRGSYIQFADARFNDLETARKYLQVPDEIWECVDWNINDQPGRHGNTRLEWEWHGDDDITTEQETILDNAVEQFAAKVSEALSGLQRQYDYLTGREAIVETIRMNDYEFTEDGHIA